jgi:hypothetical protein
VEKGEGTEISLGLSEKSLELVFSKKTLYLFISLSRQAKN